MSKTLILLSGGIDSATVLAIAKNKGEEIITLSFNYGQKHLKELESADFLASYFEVIDHKIINLDLSQWGGSSLTSTKEEIPQNGLTQGVPNTYVPGRNTIFIAIALSIAEAQQCAQVGLGVNAIDYSGYPDCRPDYIEKFQELISMSSKSGREGNPIKLWTPLIHMNKTNIIRKAIELGIPIEKTWSCYLGGSTPCGVCDSCRIRNKAIKEIKL
tara:strand:- start:15613 stop:16257 length:645 start_codon:yes stop_codon:yes gene_type:complete